MQILHGSLSPETWTEAFPFCILPWSQWNYLLITSKWSKESKEYCPTRRHRLGSRQRSAKHQLKGSKARISEYIVLLPSLNGSVTFVEAKIICRKTGSVEEEISSSCLLCQRRLPADFGLRTTVTVTSLTLLHCQSFCKWFSLSQMWHFHWERVVARCTLKFLPCFLSADALLTSDENPDDVFLLDNTPYSPSIIWSIMFNVAGSAWLLICFLIIKHLIHFWLKELIKSHYLQGTDQKSLLDQLAFDKVLSAVIALSEDQRTQVRDVLGQFQTPSGAVQQKLPLLSGHSVFLCMPRCSGAAWILLFIPVNNILSIDPIWCSKFWVAGLEQCMQLRVYYNH